MVFKIHFSIKANTTSNQEVPICMGSLGGTRGSSQEGALFRGSFLCQGASRICKLRNKR